MASTLCQNGYKKTRFFVKKLNLFGYFGPYDFVKISQAYGTNIFLGMYGKTLTFKRLPISALATVAWKSFNGKFAANIDFPMGHFILPLLMLTLGV